MGYVNVERMLQEITYPQLVEWMAFMSVEGFENQRQDIRAGLVASALYNVNRTKQTDRVFQPADFVTDYWDFRAPEKTLEQQAADLDVLASALKAMTS